jgi:hypothetical protein
MTTPSPDDPSEIATYWRLFDEKYGELEMLLADLPAEALLWKPFDQSPWQGPSNSLGRIIAHAISSTVYLLRVAEYAMGKREWNTVDGDEGRDEFGPANHDPAYLLARVRRTHDYARNFLATLGPGDLDQRRAHPRRSERIFTVRYNIQHAIEHLSQHIGHGQLTRQLWALAHG